MAFLVAWLVKHMYIFLHMSLISTGLIPVHHTGCTSPESQEKPRFCPTEMAAIFDDVGSYLSELNSRKKNTWICVDLKLDLFEHVENIVFSECL